MSRLEDFLIDSFSVGFISSCDFGTLWKCWVHTCRRSNGSEIKAPFTRRRVHLDLLRFCGVRKRRCELAWNRTSCRCTCLLSFIAEQYYIRCWTSLRRAHLASYKGPPVGLPYLHHTLHASLLFAHSCDSVLSQNLLAFLGLSSGRLFLAAAVISHATCLISPSM